MIENFFLVLFCIVQTILLILQIYCHSKYGRPYKRGGMEFDELVKTYIKYIAPFVLFWINIIIAVIYAYFSTQANNKGISFL